MPNQPGNGSSNPFGNGAGTTAGGKVAGNNFITNPGGSGARGTGRRFDNQQAAPQRPRESTADRDGSSAAGGGLIPKVEAGPNHDAGVGSVGNGAKPFRVS